MTRTASKAWGTPLTLFFIASALFGFGMSFLGVLMNLRLADLGMSKSLIGDIQSAAAFGTVLVALPAAVLFDRISTRSLLVATTLLSAMGFAALALSLDARLLFLASFVMGGASAVHGVIAAPFLMRHAGEKARSDAFGLNYGIEVAAGIIGTLVAGWLPVFLVNRLLRGDSAAMLVGAISILLAALPYYATGDVRETNGSTQPISSYLFNRNLPRFLKIIVPDILIGFGAGITIPFLNLYLKERFHLNTGTIGTALAVSNALMLLGVWAGPPLGRRFGLLRTVAGSQILSIPFMVLLALTYDIRIAVICLIARSALMNMSHPLARAFQMECIPPKDQATVNSLCMLGWSATWMLGTFVGGRIIGVAGFTYSILFTSAIYLLSTIIYLTLWARPEYLQVGRN